VKAVSQVSNVKKLPLSFAVQTNQIGVKILLKKKFFFFSVKGTSGSISGN
jgi:hypothetical protein